MERTIMKTLPRTRYLLAAAASVATLGAPVLLPGCGKPVGVAGPSVLLSNNGPLGGTVDTTFGPTGFITMNSGSVYSDIGGGVAVQPDGKFLLAGAYGGNFGLLRFLKDGTIDSGFGIAGVAAYSGFTHQPFPTLPAGVAVQSDGKILEVGSVFGNSSGLIQSVLFRYTATGLLDGTFGTGGLAIDAPTGGKDDYGYAVAVQPSDGKILVAGSHGTVVTSVIVGELSVSRYNTDGSLDTSFGTSGFATQLNPSWVSEAATSVLIQPDGKIIAVGSAMSCFGHIAMARFNPDGSADNSFGIAGYATFSIPRDVATCSAPEFHGAALQSDGKILATGQKLNKNGTNLDGVLLRVNANGTPDLAFGTNGIVVTSVTNSNDVFTGVRVQGDGKIVVAGYGDTGTSLTPFLVRYNSDGSPDLTFGDGATGADVYAVGTGNAVVSDLLLQPDGKYVLAGTYASGSGGLQDALMLLRVNP